MNERTPTEPPMIKALPPSKTGRPKWSVMIPTYNCSAFLPETISAVLANDQGADKMQIQVIDDCSTDADVEQLVRDIGKGRVDFFRQHNNVGSLRNFETCINRASGELIHILHGDDKINDGFYVEIDNLFSTHPAAGAAFTAVDYIDETGSKLLVRDKKPGNNGILENWLAQIATHNLIQPPAIVVKRMVYEKLGSFFAVHYGEDWEMWVRIAASFPVAYSPKPLAVYRYLRKTSISSSSLASGQTSGDILKVIDIIQTYLPEHQKKRLKKEATKHYSCYLAQSAKLVFENYHNRTSAIQQAKSALRMNVNRITVLSLLKLYIKIALSSFGLKSSFNNSSF